MYYYYYLYPLHEIEDRVGRLGRVTRLIRLGVRASSPTRAYNHFIEQYLPNYYIYYKLRIRAHHEYNLPIELLRLSQD